MIFRKLTVFFIIFLILFQGVNISFAKPVVYGEYQGGSIKIKSYSPSWNSGKLGTLYKELLNNFYGNEISYLGEINLYANSPDGVNGYYFQDISFENGSFTIGKNAKIELYNCERYNTVESIAGNLSHEYGHHYTTVNTFLTEGRLYNDKGATKYYSIRNLEDYPVVYSYSDPNYSYRWDIGEIMASDYVQLLGSLNAKRSVDYPDIAEKLERNIMGNKNFEEGFNLNPQLNTNIPLAAEVKGLYTYMLSLSGYTGDKKKLLKAPQIKEINCGVITVLEENQYEILWNRAIGNEPYEYTVIMYPLGNPTVATPVKTVRDGEELKAYIGSAVLELGGGKKRTYSETFEGEYEFKVYAKDAAGFIYSSEPYYYNFDNVKIRYEKEYSKPKNSFWNSIFEKRKQR